MAEFTEKEIRMICEQSIKVLLNEPVLLEISGPLNICGI